MIITRLTPNDHTMKGIVFHPGAQFIPDDVFIKLLKEDKDFKDQLKAKLMTVTVLPAAAVAGEKGKKLVKVDSLAETIVALPEEEAIAVIQEIVDGVDLKEISKLDKRRNVVKAAEEQIEKRQGTMDGMAPKIGKTHPGPIDLGVIE